MAAGLGDAFVTVRANTDVFQADLVRKLRAILAALPEQRVRVTADVTAAEREIAASARRQARELAAANQAILNDARRTAREIEAAETAAYSEATARAREAAAAQSAAARESAEDQRIAFNAARDAARLAYAEQTAAARTAAAEQAAAAREAAAAQEKGFNALKSLSSGASGIASGVGSAITSFIVKPLEVAAATAGIATAAIAFFGIKSTASLQTAKIAVEGIIGAQEQFNGDLARGQQAGADFFATLQKFAQVTPFRLQDLTKASQQLLAIGLNGDQTIGVLTDLGNALALTGDLSADRLNNAILAFTQINSLGKVTRDNIRQITSNIPTFNQKTFVQQIALLDAIKERGKGATASTADLAKAQKDLENGAVTAAIGEQAILNTLKATPGAAGAMDRAMTTLTGTISNFQDALQQSVGTAFLPQFPAIQKALLDLTPILAGFLNTVAPAVGQLVVAFGPFIDGILPQFASLLLTVVPIIAEFVNLLGPVLKLAINAVVPVFGALLPPLQQIGEALITSLVPVLPQLTDALVQLVPPLTDLLLSLVPLVPIFVQLITDGITVLAQVLPIVVPFIEDFTSAFQTLLNIPGFGEAFGVLALGVGALAIALPPLITAFETLGGVIIAARAAMAFFAGESALAGAAATALATGGLSILVTAAAAVGYEFGKWIGDKLFGAKQTLGDVGDAALDLQAKFANANQATKELGLTSDSLVANLTEAQLELINTSIQAGSFKDTASALVGALEGTGSTVDQTAIKLEQMGVSVENAQKAVTGVDTSGANAELYALKVQALITAGALDSVVEAASRASLHAAAVAAENSPGAAAIIAAAAPLAGIGKPTDDLTGLNTLDTTGGGGGGGTSSADTKAKAAAARAKAAADKIKAAFADLAGDLKAIGDKTSEQSAAQIKSNFAALIKDLKDSGNKALVAGATSVEDKLLADVKKLKPVQDKLKAELEIAQGVKDQIVGLGSVTTPSQGIETTYNGISNNLKLAIANTTRFTADIKKLQAQHLNRTTLSQLIAAGPADGLAAADALLSAGQAGITGTGGINDLQGQLTGLGNDLANDTAGELYKAGQNVGDGLLDGLKSKEKAIEDEMNKIADNMIKTVNKGIGAHSPATEFMKTGKYAMDGLSLGITNNLGPVKGAMGQAAGAMITFGPGSIAVTGGGARPEQTGQLLGSAIVGVLQQRRAQAALNGTG